MASKKASGQAIIDLLNVVLTAELTAINQYFVHGELCEHWGYKKLHERVRAQAIDEMKHAEALIERILYLDGMPNVQRLGKVTIGEDVAEQFALDRVLEEEAVPRLNAGIQLCVDSRDNGTRALLETILRSEEDHIDWLDAQQTLIKQVGLERYLAEQI